MRAGHFTEEDLIALVGSPVEANEHLAACGECRQKMESFRSVMCSLKDESVWNDTPLREAPVPQTIANLRAFANRMASEDAKAETYVRDLLEGPREGWMSKLQLHPEYRTAGVVRKLIESSERAIDTMPRDAVDISEFATQIADALDPASYPGDTVSRSRCEAWRSMAYALYYTGAFAQAQKAICVSESNLSDCFVSEYEAARLCIVKALVERAVENLSAASGFARYAGVTFGRFADARRSRSADSIAAFVLVSQHKFREALVLWRQLAEQNDENDARSYASDLSNMASCQREIGEYEGALANYSLAGTLLRDLGNESDSARVQYNIGVTLAAAGRPDEALARLRDARREFERLGMHSEAAVAALDLADLLIARHELSDAVRACTFAMSEFERSGVPYGTRARAAIAYVQEAAAAGGAIRPLIKHVRQYVRDLPRQPELLFVPPPE